MASKLRILVCTDVLQSRCHFITGSCSLRISKLFVSCRSLPVIVLVVILLSARPSNYICDVLHRRLDLLRPEKITELKN